MSKQPTKEPAKQSTAPAAAPSELEQFKTELAKKETQLQDYTEHLKRLQAEFENYCKRSEKERKDYMNYASEKLIVKLLLVIDDFDRALAQMKNLPAETKKGIEMISKNLHKVLDEEHVKAIPAVGQKLDPYKHEVLLQTESEKPEDTIIEELQRGYMMNGKVIRYSKVKVSKPKIGNTKTENNSN